MMLGGGALTQTYAWSEKYDKCGMLDFLLDYWNFDNRLKIYPWNNYEQQTTDPYNG